MSRSNLRNFMVGLTLSEARQFRESIERFPSYADEFIKELEAEDDTLIDVVFLEDHDGVFAVFPTLNDGPGLVTCYSQRGHSDKVLEYCAVCAEVIDSSRYAGLAVELCRRGVEFRVAYKDQFDWCSGCSPGDVYKHTSPPDDEGPECPGCRTPVGCPDCEYQTN